MWQRSPTITPPLLNCLLISSLLTFHLFHSDFAFHIVFCLHNRKTLYFQNSVSPTVNFIMWPLPYCKTRDWEIQGESPSAGTCHWLQKIPKRPVYLIFWWFHGESSRFFFLREVFSPSMFPLWTLYKIINNFLNCRHQKQKHYQSWNKSILFIYKSFVSMEQNNISSFVKPLSWQK